MSVFKNVIRYHRDRYGVALQGFTTLPVKWPEKGTKKRTSLMARDNPHRFLKEFKALMPYGMTLTVDHDHWRMTAPFGWKVRHRKSMASRALVIRSNGHYAATKEVIVRSMKFHGVFKMEKK